MTRARTWIESPIHNIAAGIYYDSTLWRRYDELADEQQRRNFMFGAYNAGPTTMSRAPQVPSWRHKETLSYIERIQAFFATLQAP